MLLDWFHLNGGAGLRALEVRLIRVRVWTLPPPGHGLVPGHEPFGPGSQKNSKVV